MNEFRTLRADEIDCRIATVKSSGVSLLLYKDARCDMNILDETVGSMNWQRSHNRENANCTVSIWDEGKHQWVSKEDTGTESFTEKEKGLASDSFKRACFNWGIGRELYTAPFIWISSENCGIAKKENGNGYTCNDRFYVSAIGYDESRCINRLEIKHKRTNKVVFNLGVLEDEEEDGKKDRNSKGNNSPVSGAEKTPITDTMFIALRNRLAQNSVDEEKVCCLYKVDTLSKLSMLQHDHLNRYFADIKKRCAV